MTKKLVIACILFCNFVFTSVVAQAKEDVSRSTGKEIYDPEMDCTKKVVLTKEQQKKLEEVYNRIFRDYGDLITIYSEAHALTPQQTKIRHIMLNNYIKTFYKRNYQWCSEHESDEWEEEWYNNDND